jgi:small-conductance mechanosensitive channel
LSELHSFATKFLHGLASSRLTWSFVLSFLIFLVFMNRRASVAYLWRSFHLIEDLVLEKEFFSKIDLPLKFLLLALLVTPLISFLPPGVAGPLTKLAYFVIPLLMVHVVVQGFDLIIFGWYFERHREANLPAVFRVIALSMVYIIVVLILLQHVFGLNVLPLIATSTVMTAVLGLALQDTLKNLFAGLMISLEKRFQQGDWISARTDATSFTTGEISEIGWRSVRLRTIDDNYVMIPNGTFTSAQVTNFSRPKACYARTLDLPVVAAASTGRVIELLVESMKAVRGVMVNPAPDVVPTSVKMDQVVYRLRFWVERFADADEIAGEVIQNCVARLQQESLMPSLSVTAGVVPAVVPLAAEPATATEAARVPAVRVIEQTSKQGDEADSSSNLQNVGEVHPGSEPAMRSTSGGESSSRQSGDKEASVPSEAPVKIDIPGKRADSKKESEHPGGVEAPNMVQADASN